MEQHVDDHVAEPTPAVNGTTHVNGKGYAHGHVKTFSAREAREDKFIAALLSGKNITDAAAAAGVQRQRAWAWQQQPEFRAKLQKARDMLLTGTIDQLRTGGSYSVRVLLKVMVDEHARGHERVLAAKSLLDALFKGIEVADLVDQVAELRAIVKGQK